MNQQTRWISRAALALAMAASGCSDGMGDERALEAEAPGARSPAAEQAPSVPMVLHIDGAPAAERIIAELAPDASTRLMFIASDAEDGETSVDVGIVARDGGLDYGALIESGVTPLELYLAITGVEVEDAPEPLQRAHDYQVAHTRAGGIAALVPKIPTPVLSPAPGAFEEDESWGLSSFTCLSWDNFTELTGDIFAGAPGRDEKVSWDDTGVHTLYSPGAWSVWNGGQHDGVVCNFNSAGSTPDSIDAELCHRGLGPAAATSCFGALLSDGWYIRRIYGWTNVQRTFWGEATPISQPELLSFIGIVHRN